MKNSLNPWFEICNGEVWNNGHKLISNLDLQLNLGENIVLLGPNGSGKTTLVKIISRELYPVIKSNGYIKYFGENRINLWNIRKDIGFLYTNQENRIPNKTLPIDLISAGINGIYGSGTQREVDHSDFKRTNELIEYLQIGHLKVKQFGLLSDGEKRMVLIARALINKPKVLVLDEPTCRLDLKSKFRLLSMLQHLASNGTTILQSTHDVDSIFKGTNRVILIKDCKIQKDGNLHDIINAKQLSILFNTSLTVHEQNGCWNVYPE